MNDYYVYIWKTIDTNEIFYVGSGHGIRYKDSDRQSRSPGWWDFFCSHGQKANCTSSILIAGEKYTNKEIANMFRKDFQVGYDSMVIKEGVVA